MLPLLITFVVAQGPGPTPASEVLAALADCSRLDPATAKQTRYLTMLPWTTAERLRFSKALSVRINEMSREGELKAARQVSPTLLALECSDYDWPLTVYGALHEDETYMHVKVRVGKETQTAHAPWMPKEIALLSKLTESIVPILRADYFLWATSQPKTYYAFLGAAKISDLEKAVGLDRKLIEAKRKDIAAVVAESSVTIHPRAIFRLQSSMGGWWESRDNKIPTGTGNPTRHLDKDYSFVAREFFITAPNGLFWKALASDKDDLIGEAPPDIASDSTSRTPDHRVVCPRCDICHGGQLRVPVDYIRGNLGGAFGFGIGVPVDKDKAKRLRSLYFGPFFEELAADNARLAAKLKIFGTTPAEYSKAYGEALAKYEGSLTQTDAAIEFGLTKEEMAKRIKAYIAVAGLSDLGIAAYISDGPIRREHHREMFPVIAKILFVSGP